jgi:hypothetical protein
MLLIIEVTILLFLMEKSCIEYAPVTRQCETGQSARLVINEVFLLVIHKSGWFIVSYIQLRSTRVCG